ncbi:TetR/AcrR family transcriptional regulator [Planktotalea sp.]|uniref:TetR/AcrR family transcriptional regulator n=1 Tax=Planktotalea sp. TaxID=2029877 RepID=UPI00329695E2
MTDLTHLVETDAEPKKARRATTEQRARDIVAAAAEHFSEVGFAGSTREIAKRVGVTQPLLYRYFPTKDDLIEAVYKTVYLERWNPAWDEALKDRNRTTRERFETFYRDYVETTFTPIPLRLSYYAGLRDAEINQWYNHLIEELILKQLVREHRVELGMPDEAYVSAAALEPAWQIHGGLMHYGWRKHILKLRVAPDIEQVISDNLDMYFCIAENTYRREAHITETDIAHDEN